MIEDIRRSASMREHIVQARELRVKWVGWSRGRKWGQTRGLAPVVVVDQCAESRAPDSFLKLSFERIRPLPPCVTRSTR